MVYIIVLYLIDEVIALVADCGHDSSKFGYAGELNPRYCLPSVKYTKTIVENRI